MMKRPLIFLTLLLSITAHAQTRDWENPAVLGINKLPYHATLQLPSKQKVGYSQNSMSPAEFDVTKYVRKARRRFVSKVTSRYASVPGIMARRILKPPSILTKSSVAVL